MVVPLLGPPAQKAPVKVSVRLHRSDLHHPMISVTVQDRQFYSQAAFTRCQTGCMEDRRYAVLKLPIVQTFLPLLRRTVKGNAIESMCHRGHTYPISTITAINTIPFRGVQMTQFVSSTPTPLIAGYSRVSQRTVFGNLCSSESSVVSEPTSAWLSQTRVISEVSGSPLPRCLVVICSFNCVCILWQFGAHINGCRIINFMAPFPGLNSTYI